MSSQQFYFEKRKGKEEGQIIEKKLLSGFLLYPELNGQNNPLFSQQKLVYSKFPHSMIIGSLPTSIKAKTSRFLWSFKKPKHLILS